MADSDTVIRIRSETVVEMPRNQTQIVILLRLLLRHLNLLHLQSSTTDSVTTTETATPNSTPTDAAANGSTTEAAKTYPTRSQKPIKRYEPTIAIATETLILCILLFVFWLCISYFHTVVFMHHISIFDFYFFCVLLLKRGGNVISGFFLCFLFMSFPVYVFYTCA